MTGDPRLRLWAYLLLISAGWGSGFLMIKVAAASMPPFAIATCRGGVSAVALMLFVLATRVRFRPDALQLRHMLVLGTFSGWVPNALSAVALVQIESALAAIIQAAAPLMVAVLAHVFVPDEKLDWRRGAGVLMVVVALSYAIGTIYMRRARGGDPVPTVLGQQIFSVVPAALLTATLEPASAWHQPSSVWLAMLGLGIVASAIPMVLFLRLLAFAGATQASTVGYLMPLWATALGVLVLDERIGLVSLAGAAVVLLGVWLVTGRRARTV